MTNKHCVMFGCKSDSRFHPDRKFANFVKPSKDKKRAGQWIKIVNRKVFEIKDIKKKTYICDLHFPQNADLQWWKNSLLTPTPIKVDILYSNCSHITFELNWVFILNFGSFFLLLRLQNIFSF